ncbi:MAG: putative ATP-binding protein of sugar transporter [Subtercola sp.]|nr:putative ATP-binding protein of sugar transporter [Subtercola sp.]
MSEKSVVESPRIAIAVRGLSKTYGSTKALDDVALDLRWGEVHALVGGNGSGKSTLIKILAGVVSADAGELTSAGETSELAHHTPVESSRAGLRFVHQDMAILPLLTVTENLGLGGRFVTGRFGRIRGRSNRAHVQKTLARFNLQVDPGARAATLATPQKALLAIARALQDIDETKRAILFLDEPTAALPAEEAAELLRSLRELADAGHCIVLVSHRLDEVRAAADRVTGLRDGRNAGTIDAQDLTETNLVELILGTEMPEMSAIETVAFGDDYVVDVRGAVGGPLRGATVRVRPGEIVGLAGLLGSGRTELLEMIFGVRKLESGELHFAGQRVSSPNASTMSKLGVAFLPEDRAGGGVFPGHSIATNMTAGQNRKYFTGTRMSHSRLMKDVKEDIVRYRVKASGPSALIESLSGGNQQKTALGRCLRTAPRLLLLDEPAQGIDVGARETVMTLILEAAKSGTAVIVASSEFEELTRLCHRIIVLSNGRDVDELAQGTGGHQILEAVLSQNKRAKQ